MKKSQLAVPEREILSSLLKVLRILADDDESESLDVTKYANITGYKRINIAKDYSFAAKKCLVSHRFVSAARLLDIVCQQPHMNPVFFFKATSLVLENNALTTEDDFFKFTCHVHGLRQVNKSEVILEFLMHSLKRKDLEGHRTLEVVVFGQKLNSTQNSIVDPLLKAYVGLIQYLEWARNQRLAQERNVEAAQKVISTFKEAIQTPGQWDVFVLKLVEILQFYGKEDEIEEILTKYAELNPEHINSLIYLCEYLQKYQSSREKLVKYLEELAEKCPSDSRVLTLVEMTSDTNPQKALKLLFMFLDYPCNTDSIKAWKLFSDLLCNIIEKSVYSLRKFLTSWWKHRSRVWNFIHFSAYLLYTSGKTCAKIAVYKATVVSILENNSHFFVLEVLKRLSSTSPSLHHKLKENISNISSMKRAFDSVQ